LKIQPPDATIAFVCASKGHWGSYVSAMKLSFLIPTKNRLDLLKSAISSVLAQNDPDIEIVVSDNASEQDYKSYIDGLSDSRIVYRRLSQPVSVTKNWQNALALSTGDYVLMLGDDDALAPHFGETIRPFLADTPDIVYLSAYHYAYPQTLDFKLSGYLAIVRNSEFLTKDTDPFCLTKNYARELAGSVFDFRYRFGFNAQYFLLKSSFAKKFDKHGGIYQSPYPDTFSAVVALSHAQSVLVVPTETVIIGISPKSFGAYYFSNRQEEGLKFLAIGEEEADLRRSLENTVLPGDKNNTNWLLAAEAAKRLTTPIVAMKTNIVRYRALQMIAVLRERYLAGHATDGVVVELKSKLTPDERSVFDLLEAAIKVASQIDQVVLQEIFAAIERNLGQFVKARVKFLDIGPHQTIDDAVSWLAKDPEVSLGDEGTQQSTIQILASERATLRAERDALRAERDALLAERKVLLERKILSSLIGGLWSRLHRSLHTRVPVDKKNR
jgi:hypothetical protein